MMVGLTHESIGEMQHGLRRLPILVIVGDCEYCTTVVLYSIDCTQCRATLGQERYAHSSSSPMPADQPIQPYNVYRDQLTALSQGLALWDPNPPKDIYDNVSIGDVGYLQEGAFIRMFNVMLPWDDPSNRILGEPAFDYESLAWDPFANTLKRHFKKVDHYSRFLTPDPNADNVHARRPEE